MKPISFTKDETIFVGQTDDIDPLPTKIVQYGADGSRGIISCWKPSIKDRLLVMIGKPIYLVILGNQQPPVLLSTDAVDIGAVDNPNDRRFKVEYDSKSGKVYPE